MRALSWNPFPTPPRFASGCGRPCTVPACPHNHITKEMEGGHSCHTGRSIAYPSSARALVVSRSSLRCFHSFRTMTSQQSCSQQLRHRLVQYDAYSAMHTCTDATVRRMQYGGYSTEDAVRRIQYGGYSTYAASEISINSRNLAARVRLLHRAPW